MSLPAWTVLPTIIGFFLMFFSNKEFSNYIIGFESSTSIDVVRLIINSFLAGAIPTLSGFALFTTVKKCKKFNNWYKDLTEDTKQLAFISSTVVWTLFINLTMDSIVGAEFKKKLAESIVSSGKKEGLSLKERMYAIESSSINTALAGVSIAKNYPTLKTQGEELEKVANEMGSLARQAQKTLPDKSSAGSEKMVNILKLMEEKSNEMDRINLMIQKESKVAP